MAPELANVHIVYRHVPQYRKEFYDCLKMELARRAIVLHLIYGQPIGADAAKSDSVNVVWGNRIHNRVLSVRGRPLCYQPVFWRTRNSDLIVVEQASKLVVNYMLLTRAAFGGAPVALWGHGINSQPDGSLIGRIAEAAKRHYSLAPLWWFAYTKGTADIVTSLGFPNSRITIVQNALDTNQLSEWLSDFPESEEDTQSCLYLGALYVDKRIDFLLDAAHRIAELRPGFELIVAGDGPLRAVMQEAATKYPYIKYVGPVFGPEKAHLLRRARLLLIPGAVGLVVLDGFASGTPLVTTAVRNHGPEAEYIEDGVNGIVVEEYDNSGAYARAVVDLLDDGARRAELVSACELAATRYSLPQMVSRFAEGIESALMERRKA
jgi:glycosyltransferase involved in cell wall biosynthesis